MDTVKVYVDGVFICTVYRKRIAGLKTYLQSLNITNVTYGD